MLVTHEIRSPRFGYNHLTGDDQRMRVQSAQALSMHRGYGSGSVDRQLRH